MDQLLLALRATAESTRLRLAAICAHGEFTVSELTHIIGQSQPRVSRHLKLLCEAGLLERFREQNFVYYRTAQHGLGQQLGAVVLDLLPMDHHTLTQDRQRVFEVLKKRAEEAQSVLDKLNRQLAQVRAMQPDEQSIHQTILKDLDREDLGDLIDIGTGTGRILKLLGNQAKTAVGVDISSTMLRVARSQVHEAGLGNVSIRYGDMYHLAYESQSFDTVILDGILSNAQQPSAVLIEARRLMKNGGVLLIIDYEKTASPHPHSNVIDFGVDANDLKREMQLSGLKVSTHRIIRGRSINVVLSTAVRNGIGA